MAKYKYTNKIEEVWEKAPICNCSSEDCSENNHRICGICGTTIMYGSHESVETQRNSRFAWNTDHITPKWNGGTNNVNNLQAVHIVCNRIKN